MAHDHAHEHDEPEQTQHDSSLDSPSAHGGGDARPVDHAHSWGRSRGLSGEPRRAALERGAGRGRVVLFDAFSGLAGDMIVAALVDLGVPFSLVRDAVSGLGLGGLELELSAVQAGSIGAAGFQVHVTGKQKERTFREIDRVIADAPLDSEVGSLARAIFRTLAEAEAAVHRVPLDEVHFHEVGAVDSIVDIVGAAACFAYLGAEVVCTPLPMGRGFIRCRHGILPLPPPATLECLRGVPTYDAGIAAELVTPTGAAIVKTVATSFLQWPPMFVPERIGWGKGTQELPDRPNALRVVLGEVGTPASRDMGHVVVEANIDDMTGELAGYAMEVLMEAGALDVWTSALTMKKGRPGLRLGALTTAASADRISEVMLRETTTIGVRRTAVGRLERPRRMVSVETAFGAIRIKVSGGPFGPPQIKPEFEDCVRAARSASVSVQEVIEAARLSAAQRF